MKKLTLFLNFLLNEIVYVIAVILLVIFFWVIFLARWQEGRMRDKNKIDDLVELLWDIEFASRLEIPTVIKKDDLPKLGKIRKLLQAKKGG